MRGRGRIVAVALAIGIVVLVLAFAWWHRNAPTSGSAPTGRRVQVASPAHLAVDQCPVAAVRLVPGDDLQGAVEGKPPGTNFCLAAGSYMRQSVRPKDGDGFYGLAGAILDGGQTTTPAFRGPAARVTIQGLVVQGYSLPAQVAAIDGRRHKDDGATFADAWQVLGVEVRSVHGGRGVNAGDNWIVRGSYIHDNDELGVSGSGHDVTIELNELAANNQGHYDKNWEAGGAKLVKTQSLVVRGNYVHDNLGAGLWCDIDCDGTLLENNTIVDNRGPGIFYEISRSAIIRDNRIFGNGDAAAGWLWDAGIQIAASSHVEVSGNILGDNANGIVALQQARGVGPLGPHLVADVYVHDNTVDRSGRSGVVQDNHDQSVFTRNIRYVDNRYLRDEGFAWADHLKDWQGWRGVGQDIGGSWSDS